MIKTLVDIYDVSVTSLLAWWWINFFFPRAINRISFHTGRKAPKHYPYSHSQCSMQDALVEQICHRTQPSGAWEVNKVAFWNTALHSCTCRETEFRQTPPSSVIWQKCFLYSESTQKKKINYKPCIFLSADAKTKKPEALQGSKYERGEAPKLATRKPQEAGVSSGQRGKGKLVPLDHWHLLLSWPPSPGWTQKKLCQVSVTGLSLCLCIQCRAERRRIYTRAWLENTPFLPFSLWSFFQSRKGPLGVFLNITTERAGLCGFWWDFQEQGSLTFLCCSMRA